MATGISGFLRQSVRDGFVPWAAEKEAAARFGTGAREVEAAALGAGLLPARYARNSGTIGFEGQRALHAARVAVAGCGGLGGHIVENLARLGLGTIVVVDPDSFDESNLNRQALSTIAALGRPKVEAAAERVLAINPAVLVIGHLARLGTGNAEALLAGTAAVADGLDSISSRLEIAGACSRLGVPFVHASVAGWYGQATTQKAGGKSLEAIFGKAAADKGEESRLGNQAFVPAFAAAIQTAEICKIVLGLPVGLADRLMAFDLLAMETASFPLD